MTTIKNMRASFLKQYASVPDKLRDDIVALVEDKTYSWNSAYVEVNGKTPLGDKILKQLEQIGMFKGGK